MIAALISGQLIGAPELRHVADGRTITIGTIKARVGKNTTELWQAQAHEHAAGFALMRLNAGDFVAVQGVPNSQVVNANGKNVVRHVLYAEKVTPLRPEGGDDVSLS
jgi:hypothetical protein